MPAYSTVTPTPELNFGSFYYLVDNATVDTGVTATQQVQVFPSSLGIQVTNGTNQTATLQFAPFDSTDPGTSPPSVFYEPVGTVAAATSASFTIQSQGYIRCTFSSAPTSGSLVVSR